MENEKNLLHTQNYIENVECVFKTEIQNKLKNTFSAISVAAFKWIENRDKAACKFVAFCMVQVLQLIAS